MLSTWTQSFSSFFDRRIFAIFLFGFSSGLPFLLTLSTLTIWLKELGVSNTTVGLLVMTTLPYTLKFLWGPLVDQLKIPGLTTFLGQRRSWAIVAQIVLMIMITGLGASDPENHILITALWAFGVSFFAAIQDIVVEAYRIEVIDPDQRGAAATAISLGWRLGLLTSGAGALFLAALFSWETAYISMACLMGIGLMTSLVCPRPQTLIFSPAPHLFLSTRGQKKFGTWFSETYLPPLKELWTLYDWRLVLTFIFFYKIGDTTLSVMNTPFLVEVGFTKLEIAHVAKLFGISAMVIGGVAGGLVLNKFPLLSSLILCTGLQFLSSLLFALQATLGHDLSLLVLTVGVENFTCGFGATAFIAYLSSLCSVPHTATHFALLSSFGSMARILISLGAGILADSLTWSSFFAVTAIGCLPAIIFLKFAATHPSFRTSFSAKKI